MDEDNKKHGIVNSFTDRIHVYGEVLVFLVITIFFALLAYSVKESLSPIILFIILIVLLLPFWKYSWGRVFLGLTLTFFIIWVVQKSGYLIVPFIIAILVAYLFDPLVTKLSRRIPRAIVAVLIFLPFLTIMTLFIVLVLPAIIRETQGLISTMPDYINRLLDDIIVLIENIEIVLKSILPETIEIDFIKNKSSMANYIMEENSIFLKFLSPYSNFKTPNITTIFSVVFSYLFIMPLLTFYFMIDINNIRRRFVNLLPVRWQTTVQEILLSSSKLINNYLRGMLILSSTLFLIFFIMLSIASAKYALLLAFIRGLFNIVPFVGPFVAYLIALVVGSATEAVWWHGIIKMSIIYGIGQILDTGVCAPNIIGDNVKMGPITVMFATIIGGVMFGFIGILVAVPLVGIVTIIIKRYVGRYYDSNFYQRR